VIKKTVCAYVEYDVDAVILTALKALAAQLDFPKVQGIKLLKVACKEYMGLAEAKRLYEYLESTGFAATEYCGAAIVRLENVD